MDKLLLALTKHAIIETYEDEREIDKETMITQCPELGESGLGWGLSQSTPLYSSLSGKKD